MTPRKPTRHTASTPRPSRQVVRDRHAPTTESTRHAVGDAAQRDVPGADVEHGAEDGWLDELKRKQR